MKDTDAIVQRFRDSGLKITPQRLSIFNLLKDNFDHPSAEDIYHKALEIHPTISFTTVYKTLQTLRDLGEILEINIDPERAHYDPITRDHYHTFCTRCREIEDLMSESDAVQRLSDNNIAGGFDVQSVQVHLVGVCSGCN